jgi:hypothetical protein
MQDLNKYSKDAESELLKILSEELAKSIDKEIMKSLGLESRKEKIRDILEKFKAFE